ncbi:hypothetical protein IAU59_003409 [Kwoniella sp. CBS 9459]
MSRNRVGSVKASAAENEQMSHLWHSLVDTLRLLPSIPTNPSTLKHSSSASDEDKARDLRVMVKEKKTLDEALEKLGVLIALRRGSSVPPDGGSLVAGAGATGNGGPSYTVSTPGGGAAGGIKRKRKLSVGPGSGSASPAPHGLHPGSHLHGGRDGALSPTPGYGTTKAGTPMSREATGKHKRDIYSDQLPFQPGRKVAFKLPRTMKGNDANGGNAGGGSGAAGAAGGGPAGDEWILAVVAKCIGQDKMRYEVTDIEDTSAAYNTTLRSIIPLPDPDAPSHISSHPSNLEDFGRGFQVLALYPDTTSFYRATVIAPPPAGTGNGLGIRPGSGGSAAGETSNKKGYYRLMFVDDNGEIQEVHKDFVVAYPS